MLDGSKAIGQTKRDTLVLLDDSLREDGWKAVIKEAKAHKGLLLRWRR
jgi:hypothetical protein